ncbi:hypothetical protein [Chitinophaga skermanii]|uniref:hypothetical protein n=1 Tax=Chitinophaga skermanii TaxID=331697 RepID=UPI001314970B|nr:hypothetical protein [Chitinophaga skermanii]
MAATRQKADRAARVSAAESTNKPKAAAVKALDNEINVQLRSNWVNGKVVYSVVASNI